MSRNPARLGKADANQQAIKEAIELLGFPVMDLHHAGNGVEDLLVGLCRRIQTDNLTFFGDRCYWVLVECKVASPSGKVRYTKDQLAWQRQTAGWPRITVTSAQDAVDQLRRMTE